MITDGKKWRYLAVKKIFLLLKGITSDHKGDFYCLNCCQLYSTKKNLKSIKMYVKIMIIVMQKCLKKIDTNI